jgi:peptidoglycan/LPS O-acetylase OafA/YrhL
LSFEQYIRNGRVLSYLWNILLSPQYDLPDVFSRNSYPVAVNGSLWTLPVEFSMYLLIPLAIVSSSYNRIALFFSSVFFSCLAIYFVRINPLHNSIVFYGTSIGDALELAPYFFIGACYKYYLDDRIFNLQFAAVMCMFVPFLSQSMAISEILLFLLLPYFILTFGLAKNPLFAWVGRLGDFSYGIYLYGFVVQQLVDHYVGTVGRPYLNFTLAIIPTVMLGVISWLVVEKPALRLKPRKHVPNAAQPAIVIP